MGKKRVKGHKLNSALNGEWGAHVRGWWKKLTSHLRRAEERQIIYTLKKEL